MCSVGAIKNNTTSVSDTDFTNYVFSGPTRVQILQIEFPTLGLDSVPGDSEGVNEMNESATLLRQFCTLFERTGCAAGVRVYFPGNILHPGFFFQLHLQGVLGRS